MERLYAFLLRKRKALYNFTFAYIIGNVSGILSKGDFKTLSELLIRFKPKNNLSLIIMYGLIIFSCLIGIVYYILKYWCKKNRNLTVLAKEMEKNTEPYFNQIGFQGGYSWGSDRTLIVSDNIFIGWKPESIFVEEMDVSSYSFLNANTELESGFRKFMGGTEAKNILKHKNNLDRVMLTNVIQNFDKNDKRIYLSLKKTNWCTNRFLWSYMKAHPEFKIKKIGDLYTGKGEILPNSLCLHLILVTKDNKIILTRVSNNKRNDYPSTWAATIGEQLEISDIMNGVNYTNNFIKTWTYRAVAEEFGIPNNDFDVMIDLDSLRVLALNVEGDIYNISVVTITKMRSDFSEFLEHLKTTPDSEKELAELKAITYDDILTILLNYQHNKEEYHPSTYLRLYLCYIHRYGVDYFIKKYQNNKLKI